VDEGQRDQTASVHFGQAKIVIGDNLIGAEESRVLLDTPLEHLGNLSLLFILQKY
jgi:hypothetical protein